MIMIFECWRPENGETSDDATVIETWDAARAAEEYHEYHFSDWDYDDDVKIAVRWKDESRVVLVRVRMEPVPNFNGVEIGQYSEEKKP